jgi:hypothetical protein
MAALRSAPEKGERHLLFFGSSTIHSQPFFISRRLQQKLPACKSIVLMESQSTLQTNLTLQNHSVDADANASAAGAPT